LGKTRGNMDAPETKPPKGFRQGDAAPLDEVCVVKNIRILKVPAAVVADVTAQSLLYRVHFNR